MRSNNDKRRDRSGGGDRRGGGGVRRDRIRDRVGSNSPVISRKNPKNANSIYEGFEDIDFDIS